MTAANNNQTSISQVGLGAWSLAQRAAAPAAIAGTLARRVAGMVPPGNWPGLISRYTLAAAHTPPVELTLLQRLTTAERAFETQAANAWLARGETPRPAASGAAAVASVPGIAAAWPGAAVRRTTPASLPPAPSGTSVPSVDSALQAGFPVSSGAPAQPAVRPNELTTHTALPGTVSVRSAPLPLVLAPPAARAASDVPGENGPPAPAHSALQRQVALPLALARPAQAAVVDGLQPNLSADQELASGPEEEGIRAPMAHGSNHVQHTPGMHAAPHALPQPPMLAPILRRAGLATGTPAARPALLNRMAQAISSQPFFQAHEEASIERHPGQPEQLPFRALVGQHTARHAQPAAHEPLTPAATTSAGAPAHEHGTAPEQAATAPLRSSLQRLLHAERHGTLAAPILLRTRPSQPAEPGDNAAAPAPLQPVVMRSAAVRSNPEQRPIGAAPGALPIQRQAAPQAAHDAAWHAGSAAVAPTHAAQQAQQQPAVPQNDEWELPFQVRPASAPAQPAIVAPPVQRLAQVGSAGLVAALEPPGMVGMNWDALPLVSRVAQRGGAGETAEQARAPIGHVARTAEQWSAHKASALIQSPEQGSQAQHQQTSAPGGPGIPRVAQLRAAETASVDAAEGVAAVSDWQPPTRERAAGKPPAMQRAHYDAAAATQSAYSGAPLLRTALPAGEYQPEGGQAAPARQRHPASHHAATGESPDRWRVPVPEASAPLQRADTLDMLRPLPGNIQRAEQAALPAEPAELAATAAMPGQPQRDNAGSAASSLSSVEQLDIEALAQKVYDHLRRQMRIDRERLGR